MIDSSTGVLSRDRTDVTSTRVQKYNNTRNCNEVTSYTPRVTNMSNQSNKSTGKGSSRTKISKALILDIIRLVHSGTPKIHIARQLRISVPTLNKVMKLPEYPKLYDEFMGNVILKAEMYRVELQESDPVRKKINEACLDAILELCTLMKTATSESVRYSAANEILNKGGYKAKDVVETITRNYTPEEAKQIKETLEEIKEAEETLRGKSSEFIIHVPGNGNRLLS